jgi:hypothetical protein
LDDRFAVARQIVPQCRFQFFPRCPGLLGQHRIGEKVLLQSLALRTHLGAVREVVDQLFAKALACSRHGWFLRHVLYDRRFMACERRLNEIEALIEQRLPCFLRPQDRESVGGERRRGHRLDPALRGKSHPFVDRFFRREVERVRNGVSGGGRDRLRVALVLEPSRRKTDKVDRRTPRDGDARERKLLVMKRPIAGPIRRLFSGTTSVW